MKANSAELETCYVKQNSFEALLKGWTFFRNKIKKSHVFIIVSF